MVVAQEKIMYQESVELTPAPRKQTRVKRRNRHSHIKSILLLTFIVGLTGAVGAETIQLTVVKGAQVRALQNDISNLKEQTDLLQLQADKLRSVSRIESVALSMGMEKPEGTVYMASSLPAVQNQGGTLPSQAAAQATEQTAEAKTTTLNQVSKMITSFFASTQR